MSVAMFVGKSVGRLAVVLGIGLNIGLTIGLTIGITLGATPGMAQVRLAVEINTATDEQLQSLRGIGPAMAARIIAERARAPFSSLADFDERVKGVGTITLRRWVTDGLVLATPAQASGQKRPSASFNRAAGTPMIEQFQGGGVLPTPRGRVLNLP
jgi:hypothetical protein